MTHDKIQELLGAYSIHAIGPEERQEVGAHLAECPRCRAEVSGHDEVAAMLASPAPEAPAGLWAKVARSIAEDKPSTDGSLPSITATAEVVARGARRQSRRRPQTGAWVALIGAAAAAAAWAGVGVAQLHSQVSRLNKELSRTGIAEAAARAGAGPHQIIRLTSAERALAVTILATPLGGAYWVSSSLPRLGASKTYQLWGLVNGKPVSIALVGPNPDSLGYFRLERDVRQLMVTAEPQGGTPVPTAPVVAQGTVPSRFA
jgi:anti-sigma factor RsiW